MRRFFMKVTQVVEADNPTTAEKLRRASPHWMRHTHASHALARGAGLTSVRDDLRHASVKPECGCDPGRRKNLGFRRTSL